MNLRSSAETAIRSALRRRGLAIVGYTAEENPHLRRVMLLRTHGVDLVLDIGANTGQHARHLREEGYTGRIVSFEPSGAPFQALQAASAEDAAWTCRRLAVGRERGTVSLRTFGDSVFNSVLKPQEDFAGEQTGVEEVEQVTLDDLEGQLWSSSDAVCLKVDVQGLEGEVIAGAAKLLHVVRMVEIELSTVELYEEQDLLPAVAGALYDAGLRMVSLRPIVYDHRTGYLLQTDAMFARAEPAPAPG
jgi:FkbM family methyltransferase